MRDNAQFHAGKKANNDSLEFIGSKKKSLFSQYSEQFQQKPSVPASNNRQSFKGPSRAVSSDSRPSFRFERQSPEIKVTSDVPLPDDADYLLDDHDDALKGVYQSSIVRPQKDKAQIKSKKVKKIKTFFGTTGMVLGMAIITVSVMYIKNSQPIIPKSLRTSIGFPIYELANNNSYKIDKGSVTKGENNSLVFVAEQTDTKDKYIVSQQAIPEILKTDAQYMDFLSQTDKYASLESRIGKAYFTKPANIGDDISVVVKTDSTLLFVRGNGATTEDQWSQLVSLLTLPR